MVRVLFNGLMVQNITDNGKIIKCMAKENSVGQTVVCIRVTTLTIKSTDKVFTPGLMEECTKEDFIMVSNMERDSIAKQTVKNYMVYGRKAKKVSYVKTSKNSMN